MRKALLYAIAIGGLAATAQAADLGDSIKSAKDSLPAVPDGPITWMGVTFYGTIDVGYAYTSNGLPASGAMYDPVVYTIFGSRAAHGGISTITNNALEQSKVGLKIEENLGYDLTAIGKLETGFNPISGELADACASLLRNNGKTYANQDTNLDGSRCGQAFNAAAYAGLSHPLYGTLTVGRQNNLVLDGMGTYDPMAGAYAFSLIGFSGGAGAGFGDTETARWDNSVKYIFSYGPFHMAGMFTDGGQDTPMMQPGYGGNVGFTWKGFSIDGYYTKENSAVSLAAVPNYLYVAGAPVNGNGITSCQAGVNCPNALRGTITDNEAWDVMAKYTFELWGAEPGLKDGGPACGLKDNCPPPPPPARLTFYGGYQNATLSNPDHPQQYYNGFNTIGGYQFLTGTGNPFDTNRVLQTAWAGARFETGPWAVTGAWYYITQNSYITGTGVSCVPGTVVFNGVGKQVQANCSGDLNQGSFLVDYTFNRHLDVYAGVTYSEINGGLASGYLASDDLTFATGVRLKW